MPEAKVLFFGLWGSNSLKRNNILIFELLNDVVRHRIQNRDPAASKRSAPSRPRKENPAFRRLKSWPKGAYMRQNHQKRDSYIPPEGLPRQIEDVSDIVPYHER